MLRFVLFACVLDCDSICVVANGAMFLVRSFSCALFCFKEIITMSENEVYRIRITADVTITKENSNANESSTKQTHQTQWPSSTIIHTEELPEFDHTHPYILLVKKLKEGKISRDDFDDFINNYDFE